MPRWLMLGAGAVVFVALAPVVLIVVVFGGADAAATAIQTGQACTVTFTDPAAPSHVGTAHYDTEQVTVTRTIIAIVAQRGLPERADVIALITGMVESGLHNLDHGDRDSLGVFQQRPSQGWGTAAQVMDVAFATGSFLDRMVGVADWQTKPPGDVAQTIQISGTPGAFALKIPEATALYNAFAGAPGTNVTCSSTGPAGHGATVMIDRAKTGLGLPYCYAGGNADCPTQGVATNGGNPGPNGLSPGCDIAHPGYDCSGLTLYALAGVGITVPHLASAQYTAGGSQLVALAQAQAGDLLFWSSDGDPTRHPPRRHRPRRRPAHRGAARRADHHDAHVERTRERAHAVRGALPGGCLMTTVSSEQLAHRLGLSPSGPTPAAYTDPDQPRVITVAGVGGGVGTSTVTALLGALDVGLWTHHPIAVDVLVCSPTSQSTARAEQAIGQHLAAIACTPVLVVVSDGVRGVPADSRSRLTTLRPLCRDVVHLPWVAA